MSTSEPDLLIFTRVPPIGKCLSTDSGITFDDILSNLRMLVLYPVHQLWYRNHCTVNIQTVALERVRYEIGPVTI